MAHLARRAAGGIVPAGLLESPGVALQRRRYTPPSRRTWSKQHHRIRIPRPMVDRFDLAREHPEKEWWRERRIAPATFFGFPDVAKLGLRGGSLYVEQMDSVTLSVLADKCVKENIENPEIWAKFSWRAQQMATRTHEPDLCYMFRAFARADWFDQNLVTTYLGRLHRRLHLFQLADVTVLLEAFANPKFRQGTYFQRALVHLGLLLQHRDDAKAGDLARCCAALQALWPLPPELSDEVCGLLELLAEGLLLRDLSALGPSQLVHTVSCYVTWRLVDREGFRRSGVSEDLCWALARQLRGQLRGHGRKNPEDLSLLAVALYGGGLPCADLWVELIQNLQHEAHRLSSSGAAAAVYGAALQSRPSPQLYEALARPVCQQAGDLSPLDCARAAKGFFRAPFAIAERVVLRGPVRDRILELGLDTFDAAALRLMLNALSHAPPEADGVETVACALLEELHHRLDEFTAEQLACVCRSLGYLRPEVPAVLHAVLDRAQSAVAAAAVSTSVGASAATPRITPRHVAMICRGITAQPQELLADGPARLEALLPQIAAALAAQPAALVVVQLFGCLVRCPPSEAHSMALAASVQQLLGKAVELSAPALVSLSEALAVQSAQQETAAEVKAPLVELFHKVREQLSIKRYDLKPGALQRAMRALEAAGVDFPLRLEPRDYPNPADATKTPVPAA